MSEGRIPWLMRATSLLTRWFPATWLFLLVGRARLREVARPASRAWCDPAGSALARRIADLCRPHPGESGCLLLEDGAEALMVRCALADLAEVAIDVQYYAYATDRAGLMFTQRLARAAARGVRVRILVDDIHLHLAERHLVELDGHPDIEVRSFNPAPERRGLVRVLRFLLQMDRLNRRMHDKVFAVDGDAAVIGGRNVGDRYFGAGQGSFHDLDLLVVGPAARAAEQAFDAAWNSEHAVPIAAFRPRDLTAAHATRRALRIDARLRRELPDLEVRYQRAQSELARWLGDGSALLWGRAEVLVEPPTRIAADTPPVIAPALTALWDTAMREVLIETAYFVPGERELAALCALAARGVRVKILTNSLASTDVPAVHAGYAPHRARLLAAGIELHEFRARTRRRPWFWVLGTRETVLHTKAMVVDRRQVWVGSANLDPRSAWFNTELGVLVESPALGARLARHILQDCAPALAWRLTEEGGRVVWRDASEVRHGPEPGAGRWRRGLVALVRLIPGHTAML